MLQRNLIKCIYFLFKNFFLTSSLELLSLKITLKFYPLDHQCLNYSQFLVKSIFSSSFFQNFNCILQRALSKRYTFFELYSNNKTKLQFIFQIHNLPVPQHIFKLWAKMREKKRLLSFLLIFPIKIFPDSIPYLKFLIFQNNYQVTKENESG